MVWSNSTAPAMLAGRRMFSATIHLENALGRLEDSTRDYWTEGAESLWQGDLPPSPAEAEHRSMEKKEWTEKKRMEERVSRARSLEANE